MNAKEALKKMEKTSVALLSSFLGLWPTLRWDGTLHPELDVVIPLTLPREKLELLRKYHLIHRQGRFLYLNKLFSEDYLPIVLDCLGWYYDFTVAGISLEKRVSSPQLSTSPPVPGVSPGPAGTCKA